MKRRTVSRISMVLILVVMMATAFSAVAFSASGDKPLEGKYISVIGDSISTYTGWSDNVPITDESCTYRYGEAYYGPVGSGCHNEDLLVTDTWWHQAATETGAEMLVVASGNSTGVFHASYPSIPEWDAYLKDMAAWKTRPYHLAKEEQDPDIIALYIGSNDVAKEKAENFGSVDAVNFDTLIQKNSDGSYTYATPVTVAEAYCIMMHKVSVTYPDAEIYCFAVIPNSGGYLSTVNTRLKNVYLFNDIVYDAAAYFDANVVDLMDAFALDPDGDGVATQEDFDRFKTYFNGDPHPNALGFDVITDCFVEAVTSDSRFIAEVETKAGLFELIGTDASVEKTDQLTRLTCSAKNYVTESGMKVKYNSTEITSVNGNYEFTEEYTSKNKNYSAVGGSEIYINNEAPEVTVNVPMTAADDAETADVIENQNQVTGPEADYISQEGQLEDDGEFEFSQVIRTAQGSVTVTTTNISRKEGIALGRHKLTYVRSTAVASAENGLQVGAPKLTLPETAEDVPEITEGYEYVYLGSDQLSNYWAALAFTFRTGNETPIYQDENVSLYVRDSHSIFQNRNLMVDRLYMDRGSRVYEREDGSQIPLRFDSVMHFTVSDAEGNILSAYCADQVTPAVEGHSYRIENLEDATYYSEDEAAMIRAIAYNGYWGTDEGFGSLEYMRSLLRETGKFTEEELAALNDGKAMTATQYAIWTFSNIMDQRMFLNVYYTEKRDGSGLSAASKEDADLIFKVYAHLVNLDPETAVPVRVQGRTIINEKNFIDTVSLTLKDKPEDNPANMDADDTNDVYTADLSFSLKVQPKEENGDRLVITVTDEEGKVMAAGRVAGEANAGEVKLKADGEGVYTFKNIPVSEGNHTIKFSINGVQYLDKGAYLLTSEVKAPVEEPDGDPVPSQTLVGVAEGQRNANASNSLTFTLDVEDEEIFSEHIWRYEGKSKELAFGNADSTVKTGDDMPMLTLIAILVLAAGTMIAAVKRKYN